jgi:DnaJ-class molecular chaperone
MICYQCQGTGFAPERPGWPCPLCQGQRFIGCCEGDVEQPEPAVNAPASPPNGSGRDQVERVRAQRLQPLHQPIR